MTAGMTIPAVLMDVLDVTQTERWEETFTDAAAMVDGCRAPGWNIRFAMAHMDTGDGDTTWAQELEHSAAHILAAEPGDLRGYLLTHAALVATWLAAVDARGKS